MERIEFRFEWGMSHGRKRQIVAKGDIYLRTDWSMLTGDGRGDCPNFEPARAVVPFAGLFLGPVEPVFLEAFPVVRGEQAIRDRE